MTTTTTVEAWHFVRSDGTLGKRPDIRVEPGMTLEATERPLVLCRYGLHASLRAVDALPYAPGPVVCRVRLHGEILEGNDKLCATHRTVLWMADATRTLDEFAVWCAERALMREREAGREPDPRSWAALDTKRRWLNGEATDLELATAANAARAAAWGAASSAAWAAARDAAWAAARDAAWAAAGDAEKQEQNAELERRLWALKEGEVA